MNLNVLYFIINYLMIMILIDCYDPRAAWKITCRVQIPHITFHQQANIHNGNLIFSYFVGVNFFGNDHRLSIYYQIMLLSS